VVSFRASLEIPYGSLDAKKYCPGFYILLEFADAGVLFDYIGESPLVLGTSDD
jgi:hypothetical protein